MKSLKEPGRLAISGWVFGGVVFAVLLIVIALAGSVNNTLAERDARAFLYSRTLEGTLSRLLEALEISMSSLADEIHTQYSDPDHSDLLHERMNKILHFAPHLRQIMIVHGDKVIADTNTRGSTHLQLEALGLNLDQPSALSLGLMIGNRLNSRYLPYKGQPQPSEQSRQIIPIGFAATAADGTPLLIIAAFNPAYLKRSIDDLQLEHDDQVHLVNLEGTPMLQDTLPFSGDLLSQLEQLVQSGKDESQQGGPGLFPAYSTTLRLLPKYPLAVTVVIDHQKTLKLWLRSNRSLLILMAAAVAALSAGAVLLGRYSQRAMQMKAEVRLLSKVVESSPALVVITDPAGDIEYVNHSFEQATGYSYDEVVGRNPRFLKSGETSDEAYEAMWEQLCAGETWEGEFHNKRKDGSFYWERASISPLMLHKNEISHFIALKQPITEEKEAQQKLRLAGKVFSAAAEAIMVTDADNRIQMVNRSFERITGYSETDVLGCSPSILKSGEHTDAFYQALFSELTHKGFWAGEIWNKRKNGELYPQWVNISSRLDDNGQLEGYIALFSDITKRKQDEALIKRQANYDSLTSLPNRNLFHERLQQALALAERQNTQTALLYIDLDRFKYVNDTFGHYAGDQLLQQVAQRLRKQVRKSDTVARLGGDEFAVILPQIDAAAVAERVANKILDTLRKPYQLDTDVAFISSSIGIALYPDNGRDYEQLIINADSAMYQAKERGRNTLEYFSDQLNTQFQSRRALEKDLYSALEKSQFLLEYQPIWSSDCQDILSLEALIRWQHPEKGRINPGLFIGLAEESAFIHDLGDWIIDEAIAFTRKLLDHNGSCPKMSINLSGKQFLKGGLCERLARALDRYQVAGSQIIIEITENVLLLDQESILQQLNTLVDMGMEIAIDDFGTGYSSLSYLKKYPIQRIKIDQSFVAELDHNAEDQALVSGIISLAESLSLKTVVEGVETATQLDFLQQCGTPMIQGFLCSRPLPEERVLELLS